MNIKEAAQFYIEHGMRPMPIHGVSEGCKHKKEVCDGQCWGKVPTAEHWPDHDFGPEDFNNDHNLALVMGKQNDGRWLIGLDIDGEFDLSEFINVPDTLESSTNRGRHLIFEINPDAPLGNWIDIFGTRSDSGYRLGYNGAVDLKYCRGAMVSPPSINKSGQKNHWKEWREPAQFPESEIIYLMRKRKFQYPHIKRYSKWSTDPMHKGKRP